MFYFKNIFASVTENLCLRKQVILRNYNSENVNVSKVKDIPEYEIVTELPKVNIPKEYTMSVNKDSLISIKNFTENRCI